MKTIEVSKAYGLALDWLVVTCANPTISTSVVTMNVTRGGYNPTTCWLLAGPIIAKERICLTIGHDGVWLAYSMQNYDDFKEFMYSGPTPLVAAMRCYVASKLGATAKVPERFAS